MDIFNYRFVGYEAYYQDVLPELQKKIFDALQDEDYHFILAVNEAVCNAARYALNGVQNAEIEIKLKTTEYDISATIRAKTHPFDVEHYRNELLKLLSNKELCNMEWGDYTADTEKSRGFWYMLTACDYLYMDDDGQEITLCARAPYDSKSFTTKIGHLVPRFFIKKNGVIL
ncbi:MAG: hypothetical protein H6Q70_121 [Firmicutes bacterium]|nr:hypothetical protein [Bacillota bacterium]